MIEHPRQIVCAPSAIAPMRVFDFSRQLAAAAALIVGPHILPAQIPSAEFAARRDSLAARIGDGVVVAFGGRTPVTDFGTFFQLPAFHYLTNYDEPDAAFVFVAHAGRGAGTLFTTPA